jgi:hypothetical protein
MYQTKQQGKELAIKLDRTSIKEREVNIQLYQEKANELNYKNLCHPSCDCCAMIYFHFVI